MNTETIASIILLSVLAVMQISTYITCIIYRKTKYHKGLNYSVFGFIFLFFSTYFGVFMPIYGFIFNGNNDGQIIKYIVIEMVLTIVCLIIAIRGICFCIYLEGNYVVKKTLFSEIRIDLTDSATKIDDSMPHSKDFWTTIYSSNGKIIQFRACAIGGNANQFIKDCCDIQNKSQDRR